MKSGTSPADLHRNLDAARQGATGRWGAYTAASSPPRRHPPVHGGESAV